MQALVFGDLHGKIRAMYARAADWEREEDQTVEAILQVGDFGIYPEPARMKPEKQVQYGPGDYHELVEEDWQAPIPTWFCKGNNEDFDALDRAAKSAEGTLLPNLHYVPNGSVRTVGSTRVAFLGGAWSRKSWEGPETKPKHIGRKELENLYEETFDILICHEAPGGVKLPGRIYSVGAAPLRTLIENKRPRLVVHGHHHQHAVNWIGMTKVITLSRFYPASRSNGALIPLEL